MIAVPQSALHLRAMQADDVDAVLRIERNSQPVPWSEGILRDCLKPGYWSQVVETHAGEVAAFAILTSGGGDGHLLNIAVAPGWRRQGIARWLVGAVIDAARLREVTTLFLEVRTGNTGAIALYHDMGFVEVGLRRGYYPLPGGGREDAMVMALPL